ncbi:MAG: PEGA domain-containing protein [Blastocatellia bacterium]
MRPTPIANRSDMPTAIKSRASNLILGFFALTVTMMAGCNSSPPANNKQAVANANTSQSNSSQASQAQQSTSPTTGAIEVNSVPTGARVLLVSTEGGGAGEPQPKGLTPATISGLAPGKYTVDVERAGYKFFQKEVDVKAGKTIKINATLQKH